MEELKGLRVAILATDMFEESELVEPREALEEVGADTTLIAPHDGQIQAAKHFDKSMLYDVDMTLDEADANDYDALLLPGGALNADQLRIVRKAQEFTQSMDEAGKPIAVICHGPWLLISAKLAGGRKITSFHSIRDDLVNAGAEWVDQAVVSDRNWLSSRQPSDIPAFNEAMISLFKAAKPVVDRQPVFRETIIEMEED